MHLLEVPQLPLDDELRHAGHRVGDVAEEALALASVEELEQGPGLAVVVVALAVVVAVPVTRDSERRLAEPVVLYRSVERVRLVESVRVLLVVVEEPHRTVLVVVVDRTLRRVDRQCFVVRPKTVPVGVRVGEYPRLEHLVRRETDPGHDVRWRERELLDLGKVVVGVAVQLKDADLDQRVVAVRPTTLAASAFVQCLWPCSVLKWNLTQKRSPSLLIREKVWEP